MKTRDFQSVWTFVRMLVSCALLLAAGHAGAAVVEMPGLFKATVPVADRSDAERRRAQGEGLVEVLIRASGDSTIGNQDAVVAAAREADRYLLQYSYDTRPGADGEPQIVLKLDFDGAVLQGFLRRSGLPVWSSSRIPLLIWMVWEQELDRDGVNAASNPGAHQILQQEGKRRGVPLLFPAYDSEDQSHATLGDIWGLFPEPVLAASVRYDTPLVLMARVRETASAFQISALLHLDGQKQAFEIRQADSAAGLRQLLDRVADKMGDHFGLVASRQGGQQEVILEVARVNRLVDFAALTAYLDGVMPISLYRVQSVAGDHARFALLLDGGLEALEQVFRQEHRLVPALVETPPLPAMPVDGSQSDAPAAPHQAPTGPVVIQYEWRG